MNRLGKTKVGVLLASAHLTGNGFKNSSGRAENAVYI